MKLIIRLTILFFFIFVFENAFSEIEINKSKSPESSPLVVRIDELPKDAITHHFESSKKNQENIISNKKLLKIQKKSKLDILREKMLAESKKKTKLNKGSTDRENKTQQQLDGEKHAYRKKYHRERRKITRSSKLSPKQKKAALEDLKLKQKAAMKKFRVKK